jgi:hypothetical protein
MITKNFSFAAVMSIVTRRNLTESLEEQYSLLDHLLGGPVERNHDLNDETYQSAGEVLSVQFPTLWDGQMQFHTGMLIEMLKTESGKQNPKALMLGWLSEQAVRLGFDMNEMVGVKG